MCRLQNPWCCWPTRAMRFLIFNCLFAFLLWPVGAGGRRWQLKKTAHIIRFWLDCSMAFGFSGGCALVLSHFSIKVHYFLVFIGIGFISFRIMRLFFGFLLCGCALVPSHFSIKVHYFLCLTHGSLTLTLNLFRNKKKKWNEIFW